MHLHVTELVITCPIVHIKLAFYKITYHYIHTARFRAPSWKVSSFRIQYLLAVTERSTFGHFYILCLLSLYTFSRQPGSHCRWQTRCHISVWWCPLSSSLVCVQRCSVIPTAEVWPCQNCWPKDDVRQTTHKCGACPGRREVIQVGVTDSSVDGVCRSKGGILGSDGLIDTGGQTG